MKVAVIGATGSTGLELVAQALVAGHEVYAFARNPGKITLPDSVPEECKARLHLIQGSVEEPSSLVDAIKDADVVYEALGTSSNKPHSVKEDGARAIIDALKESGRTRLVGISSFGINPKFDGHLKWFERAFVPLFFSNTLQDLKNFERVVTGAGDWLDYTIVQPGVISLAPLTGKYELAREGRPVGEISFADVAAAMLEIGEKGLHSKVHDVIILPQAPCHPFPENKEKLSKYFSASLQYRLTQPATLATLAAVSLAVVFGIRKARGK